MTPGELDLAPPSEADLAGEWTDDLASVPDQSLPGLKTLAFAHSASVPVGARPLSLVTADFDMDGRMDLAVVEAAGNEIAMLLGNGNGTFKSVASVPISIPIALAVGDFNADKHRDLVVGVSKTAEVYVVLGHGNRVAVTTMPIRLPGKLS